jgi:hypothetical protein
MLTVAGIFTECAAARRALRDLRILGINDRHVDLLVPGAAEERLSEVPTADTEQPGMGKAVGSVVGSAVGVASGLTIGAAIGPVLVLGGLGAAVLGLAGLAGGAAVGETIDRTLLEGLPKDELFVYEDALRQGRCVLICLVHDEIERQEARRVLDREGAESIDAARHRWWIGLRDAEREHYTAAGSNFETDEERYRRGFEAAHHPEFRGRKWDDVLYVLVERYPHEWDTPCFRAGFERGQRHCRSLQTVERG